MRGKKHEPRTRLKYKAPWRAIRSIRFRTTRAAWGRGGGRSGTQQPPHDRRTCSSHQVCQSGGCGGNPRRYARGKPDVKAARRPDSECRMRNGPGEGPEGLGGGRSRRRRERKNWAPTQELLRIGRVSGANDERTMKEGRCHRGSGPGAAGAEEETRTGGNGEDGAAANMRAAWGRGFGRRKGLPVLTADKNLKVDLQGTAADPEVLRHGAAILSSHRRNPGELRPRHRASGDAIKGAAAQWSPAACCPSPSCSHTRRRNMERQEGHPPRKGPSTTSAGAGALVEWKPGPTARN